MDTADGFVYDESKAPKRRVVKRKYMASEHSTAAPSAKKPALFNEPQQAYDCVAAAATAGGPQKHTEVPKAQPIVVPKKAPVAKKATTAVAKKVVVAKKKTNNNAKQLRVPILTYLIRAGPGYGTASVFHAPLKMSADEYKQAISTYLAFCCDRYEVFSVPFRCLVRNATTSADTITHDRVHFEQRQTLWTAAEMQALLVPIDCAWLTEHGVGRFAQSNCFVWRMKTTHSVASAASAMQPCAQNLTVMCCFGKSLSQLQAKSTTLDAFKRQFTSARTRLCSNCDVETLLLVAKTFLSNRGAKCSVAQVKCSVAPDGALLLSKAALAEKNAMIGKALSAHDEFGAQQIYLLVE